MLLYYYKILVGSLYASVEYIYSSSCPLKIGQIVEVEYGKKLAYGVCSAQVQDNFEDDVEKKYVVKSILKVFDYVIDPHVLKFTLQFGQYNLVSIGSIIQLILPVEIKSSALHLLYEDDGKIITLAQLLKKRCKRSAIEKMKVAFNEVINYEAHDLQLTSDQEQAVEKIAKLSNVGVLSGSTGSGKTIVALKGAIENIKGYLSAGAKILILTPEVSLGKNWGEVILKHFGQYTCFYNYQVSDAYKESVFAWAMSNQPGIIIGARSALFLPYKNLRMIIIDEEHSSSLKQERYPRYHARDMAILRCNIERIPCLLLSATPSLETQYNIELGKYTSIQLSRTPLHGKAEYQFVQAEKSRLLASPIIDAMSYAFENRQQVLLFLNRRGYAPYCLCSSCNNVLNCKGCDVPMIFYNNHSLTCHKCEYKSTLPVVCPNCRANTTWKFYGIGIERLLEFVQKEFPNKAIEAVTSKTKELDEYINGLNTGKIDCLIATQVLAQGHDFKNISLVVIVDGDMGLNSPDFRSTERMYQLWSQLRGRSARHATAGKFIVQAVSEGNRFLSIFNSDDVYNLLLEERKHHKWPPFARCAFIIIKSKNYKQAQLYFELPEFEELKKHAQKHNIEFYGPLHIGKQNFINEWRFLVKVERTKRIDFAMRSIIDLLPKMKQIKVEFEVDPYTFT